MLRAPTVLAVSLVIALCVAATPAQVTPGVKPGRRTTNTDTPGVDKTPVGSTDIACVWEPVTKSPISRFESLTVVIDGEIYLFGGFQNPQLEATARVDVYDPATDTWRSEADIPGVPVTHSGVEANGTDVWIAGGFIGDSPGPVTDEVWRYDTVNDTWHAEPSLPEPRGACQLVKQGRYMYLFGGVGVNKNVDEEEVWRLDLQNPTAGWATIAPLPEARNHLGGVAHGGLVYAIGGQIRHDSSPLDTVFLHVYTPQTDTWTRLADLPEPKSHFEPGTFLWGDKIVICGGRSLITGQSSARGIAIYDIPTDTWTEAAPLPFALNAPSVQLVDGVVTLIGGAFGSVNPQDEAYQRSITSLVEDVNRFNAGGPAIEANTNGIPVNGALGWCGDAWFADGKTFTASSSLEIAGTKDDALYRSERNGGNTSPSDFDYDIPLEPGLYRVTLRFAEIYWGVQGPGAPGKRVFDVTLEDELVLDDYDIFADVGAATAARKDFAVAVLDGNLDMHFLGVVDQPKLSGFEIQRIGDVAAAAMPTAAAPSALDFALVADDLPAGASGLFVVADRRVTDGDLLSFAESGTTLERSRLVATIPATVDADGVATWAIPTAGPTPSAAEVEVMARVDVVFLHRGGVVPAAVEAARTR